MKLWGGRFSRSLDAAAFAFSSSLNFDKELLSADITGSMAHAKMLHSIGILSADELEKITAGLQKTESDYRSGAWVPSAGEYEDIHSAVEAYLKMTIGTVAGKLHTGRSRNDQVATDIRLWCKSAALTLTDALKSLSVTLLHNAAEHTETIIPGYTHLQRAQPVSLAFHLCAYTEMFERDRERLQFAYNQANSSPLGSGALAGSTLPLDRDYTARELGFASVTANALDAVSNRDFIADFLHACSLGMVHLSRLAEELVLWTSSEWNFAELDDSVTTGSSLMPQKKNPDLAELIRGKTARVLGNDVTLKTLLKGLPLSYNRDLQEDKEPLFNSVESYLLSLQMAELMFKNITFKVRRSSTEYSGGFMLATDLADYLVLKGLPFREAHEITGAVVKYCEQNSKVLQALTLSELTAFSGLIEQDVTDVLNEKNALHNKKTYGSPNPAFVKKYIEQKLQLLQ